MDVYTVIGYLLLGGILGAIGQGLRVIVGLKKQYDQALKSDKKLGELFDTKKLWLSFLIAFIIGGIAGTLGVIRFLGEEITKESIIILIAIGYAGTDFIEGFVKKTVPK